MPAQILGASNRAIFFNIGIKKSFAFNICHTLLS